jgi:hypothetical protein
MAGATGSGVVGGVFALVVDVANAGPRNVD